MDAMGQDRRFDETNGMSALRLIAAECCLPSLGAPGHVWTAPGWQGFSSRVQQWSEQPCVRPVSAVTRPALFQAFDNADKSQKFTEFQWFDTRMCMHQCGEHFLKIPNNSRKTHET
jgi:hypothetical protein